MKIAFGIRVCRYARVSPDRVEAVRGVLVALLVAVVLAGPVQAAEHGPIRVQADFDLFQDIDLSAMDPDTACDEHGEPNAEPSTLTVDEAEDALLFTEGEDSFIGAEPPPEARTGCVMVRFHVDVPNGTDHIHICFDADRRIVQPEWPPAGAQYLVLAV